jgi:hypothetical protein
MSSQSPVDVARTLAAALDEDDFATAGRVIHEACTYDINDETITGRDAIIDRYRRASREGRAKLDGLEFDSRVDAHDDQRATITYIDDLTQAGRTHRYTCRQIVTIEHGLVTHIRHVELPDEREALNTFYAQVGLPVSQ